jgi:uncharacterized membrane protein YesL
MLAAFKVLFAALNDVRLKGYTYIWANVAFMALSLPIVTAPAAYSALCRVALAARTQPWDADLDLFWQTFRANVWRAMPWGAAHALFAYINFTNLATYTNADDPLTFLLRAGWWGATLVWAGVLLYTWFIYYEMAQPTLWGATRNALVMVLLNPFFTLLLLFAIIILAVVSISLPALLLLLTWGVVAAIGSVAVIDRIQRVR